MDNFARRLLSWFDVSGRHDLPWQKDITSYRVWISEIMLQQTQVATVIPYYQRFMQSFPTIAHLAEAEEDKVLHHWSGLGYYARARNLHKTAKLTMLEFNGELPPNLEQLVALPGIGRSTASAILAIAHSIPAAILDGNVKRVLARHNCIEGWPGKADVLKDFWQVAEQHTPQERVADYTQAIMDLGATICTRSSPKCTICPIASDCQALATDKVSKLPHKKPKKQLPVRSVELLIFEAPNGEVYLEKRPASGIWGGLWSFPEANDEQSRASQCEKLAISIPASNSVTQLATFRHTFSHFHLDIQPIRVKLAKWPDRIEESAQSTWYDPENPVELGLAAPVTRLLKQLRG